MLEGQKCLVIGSGISGIGAVALLEKYHADVVLYDSSDKLTKEDLEAKLPGESKAVCIAGELPEEVELSIQAAVLSPGVPTDIPLVNRMRERGIVDIETLKTTNQTLMTTLDEVMKIQEEGRARRQSAEEDLQRIENEMREKLLEMSQSSHT